MKKRRTFIVSMLLVAALALGIGYAALTDVLEVTGRADINQSQAEADFDLNVKFTDATKTNEGDIVTFNEDSATFEIKSLSGKDDVAEFTFTITNSSDLDAIVTPTFAEEGNTNTEYFSIVSDWAGQPKEIKAGQSETYTVTVTLLKTPTDTIFGSFRMILTAVAE